MKQNYLLHIKDLNNASDIDEYKSYLKKDCDVSAYYFIEHLKHFAEQPNLLKYFVFFKEGQAIVLMPFILREIHINNVKQCYFDVTSPYGYNGPVFCKNGNDQDIVEFWKSVDIWYKNNNIVSEFIRFSLNGNHIGYSGSLAKTLSNVKGGLCNTFESNWNAFLPKVRNNYRKAEKHELKFDIFHCSRIEKRITKIFIDIYIGTMKRRGADNIYYFSTSYFENLILSNSNNFSIAVVYLDDKPISTELIIHHKEILYAFLGGTDSEYYKYRPNDFLRVNIIKWAIENNFKYYVLGGGVKEGDGLYKNKKALFPKDKDVIFYTGRKIVNQEKYDEFCSLSIPDYTISKQEVIHSAFFPYYRYKPNSSHT